MAGSCEPLQYERYTGLVQVTLPTILLSFPLVRQELPKTLPTSSPHFEMQWSRLRLDQFLCTAASYLMKEPSSSILLIQDIDPSNPNGMSLDGFLVSSAIVAMVSNPP